MYIYNNSVLIYNNIMFRWWVPKIRIKADMAFFLVGRLN